MQKWISYMCLLQCTERHGSYASNISRLSVERLIEQSDAEKHMEKNLYTNVPQANHIPWQQLSFQSYINL